MCNSNTTPTDKYIINCDRNNIYSADESPTLKIMLKELKKIEVSKLTSEHNKALVPDGCFFSVGPDNVVLLLSAFEYLSKCEIFRDYTFVIIDNITPQNDKANHRFHRLYTSLFDTSHLPNSHYQTLSLDRNDIKQIYENCKLFAFCRKPKEIPLEINCTFPLFVKTETSSGKNDIPIKKINNIAELFERMYSVKSWSLEYEDFLKQKYSESKFKFFIAPWQDITEEYRCFVYRRQIVSVCPQKFWECYGGFEVSLDDINKLQSSFVHTYQHDNYCIDVHRPFKGADLVIIETNQWYNSGPGLFTYQELKSIPQGCVMYKYLPVESS
jgi:hypothetical protein